MTGKSPVMQRFPFKKFSLRIIFDIYKKQHLNITGKAVFLYYLLTIAGRNLNVRLKLMVSNLRRSDEKDNGTEYLVCSGIFRRMYFAVFF